MEQSAISKTNSDYTSNQNVNALINGKVSPIDIFFPFIDACNQHIEIPKIFTGVFIMYNTLQLVIASMWHQHNLFIKADTFENKIINVLEDIVFWGVGKNALTPKFIVLTVIFLLCLIFIIFQVLHLKKYHSLITWTLYPTRIIADIIPMILLHPCFHTVSYILVDLIQNGNNALDILYMVLLVVYSVFFVILFLYCGFLNSYSAYLQSGLLACFDFTPFAIIGVINPIFVLVLDLFSIFPNWFSHPIIFAHALAICLVIYKLRIPAFISSISDIMMRGVAICCVVEDLLVLISGIFKNNSTEWVTLITLIVSLIIGISISVVIQKATFNKVRRNLAYNGEISRADMMMSKNREKYEFTQPTEQQKKEIFDNLGLDQDPKKIEMYLRIGLANICDLVTDLSIIKYALENYTQTDVIATIARVVAFIPPEIRLLNLVLSNLMLKRDLKVYHRFLIYQLSHIKVIRQSGSSSLSASERLVDLKAQTRQCQRLVAGFWSRNDAGIAVFSLVHQEVKLTRTQWEESIKKFPNSTILYEQFTNFLIECATDFTCAVIQHNKSEMLENGRMFSIDYCFRSLVAAYPLYLKRKIFDIKGNYINIPKHGRKGSTINTSHSNSISSLSASANQILDASVEDRISKLIFTRARARLAFQRAIEGRKANSEKYMLSFSSIGAIFTIGIIIAFYVSLYNVFSQRSSDVRRVYTATLSRYHFSETTIFSMTNWASKMSPQRFNMEAIRIDDPKQYSFDVTRPFEELAIKAANELRETLSEFMSQLSELSMNRKPAIKTGGPLMVDDSPTYFCKDGKVLDSINMSMRTLLITQVLGVAILNGNKDYPRWFEDDNFCSLSATTSIISEDYDRLIDSLMEESQNEADSLNKEMRICEITITVSYFFICMVGFSAVSASYIIELKKLLKLMRGVDQKDRREALEPIAISNTPIASNSSEQDGSTTAVGLYIGFTIVLFILLSLIAVLVFELTIRYNDKLVYLGEWNRLSNMRTGYSLEAVFSAFMAVWTDPGHTNSMHSESIDSEKLVEGARGLVNQIKIYSEQLSRGNGSIPSWSGYSAVLDKINYQPTCVENANPESLHDTYNCAAAVPMEGYFVDIIGNVLSKISSFEALGSQKELTDLFHILFGHLVPFYNRITDELIVLVDEALKEFDTYLIIICLVGIVLGAICLTLLFGFMIHLNNSYRGAMTILRRLNPTAIINNQDLVDYLLNNAKKNEKDDSTAASIIRYSSDCIICLNNNGIIENVNNIVTSTLGYTPEQLLGQNITILFDEENAEEVRMRMQLIADKQAPVLYEDHIVAKNDMELLVHCKLTLLGMMNESDDVKAYVIILRNEEELIEQQLEAERAKKKSEELLYQILPRDIVMKLNAGEKDVTFSVPSASVMFIDIVKFSDYAAGMPPAEIMGNLSQLFCAFDEAAAKYNHVIKIKLIGDVYMAAAGLFAPHDTPAKEHAEQLLRFGFDCLNAVEDLNVHLSSSLQVRIGLNTGGPLLAGILGTDKPVFDIIGDTINVAARLQSTDIPGKIQVSQATYELIKGMDDLDIEARGEIFLKGKGNQPAYLVQPLSINTMMSFSLTNTITLIQSTS